MRRWEFIAAVLGAILCVAALVWEVATSDMSSSRAVVTQTVSCNVVAQYKKPLKPRRDFDAVIIHGLSANRKLMEPVANWIVAAGRAAYTIDMPGHGDSAEPFSFERAEQCAAEFLSELTARGALDPARTVLIGHSTGAGIAIRLADRFDAAATIALSPAPLTPQPPPFDATTPFTLPTRLPANLLVFIASLDPWPIRDSAKEWIAATGGTRDSDADFAARRALRLTDLPRSNHTSLLVDSRVARETADWLQRALGLERHTPYFRTPPFGFAIALLGLFLTFPAASTLLLGRAQFHSAASSALPPLPAQRHAYALWTIAAILGVLLLKFWIPLRLIRLFSGDYLASLLLFVALLALAGCPILAVFARVGLLPFLKSQISDLKSASTPVLESQISDLKSPSPFAAGAPPLRGLQGWEGFSPYSLLASIFLAFVFFLAGSWLFSWQLSDVWLNGARWLRFPALLLPMFAYALAEEIALGPPHPGRADVFRRLLRALTLRLILLIAMLAAVLLLASNQILIPLLFHFMFLFSICQRLGADAIRRRTGSALSAAVFSAILASWYIAAVFPLL